MATSALIVPGAALGRGLPLSWRVALPVSPVLEQLPRPDARTSPYGWPLRPFDRQHAIRGGFGDPRFGLLQRNFHFGIDIPAPAGTPVYAVSAGTVFLAPDRVDVLTRGTARRTTGFSYWHILAAVREHRFVRQHALLGWVSPLWGHLHFAELQDGAWVNPLRPDALTPYQDDARPTIDAITVTPHTAELGAGDGLGGPIDVTVDAYVVPPLPLPPPWQDTRVAPTVIRWRLVEDSVPVSAWTNAVDFSQSIPPNGLYDDVYAPGTAPNGPNRPGHYLFYLARDWNLTTLIPGNYLLEVQALGPRGVAAEATTELDIPAPDTAAVPH